MIAERELLLVSVEMLHTIDNVHLAWVDFNIPGTRATPFDIGCWCYTSRRTIPDKKNKNIFTQEVDITTLSLSRKKFLFDLIQACHVSGHRNITKFRKINVFSKIIKIAEEINCPDFLDSEEACRNFYFKLNVHFRNSVLNQKDHKHLKLACRVIDDFKNIIRLVHGRDYIYRISSNIQTIPKARRDRVKPAHDSVVFYSIKQYKGYAFSVCEALISNTPYPFRAVLNEGHYYIYPGKKITLVDLVTNYNKDSCVNFKKHDFSRSCSRLLHANWAFHCFMKLFIIITGISASEIKELEYNPEHIMDKDYVTRNFRAIKYRAKGRITTYSIESNHGVEIYKKMLALRSWILNGKEFKYLFFGFSILKNGIRPSKIIDVCRKDFEVLNGYLFPRDFEYMTPTVVRKSKSKILHALKISTNLVANNLNHSNEVNAAAYQISDINEASEEISRYWDAMRFAANKIKISLNDFDEDTSIAVGHCKNIQYPLKVANDIPFVPDCSTQYGCLYCENYVVHADEEDLHKLESLAYVLDKVINYIACDKTSIEGLTDLYVRVNYIVDVISNKNDHAKITASEAKEKVYINGILTTFWELRLQRYESLGVIL